MPTEEAPTTVRAHCNQRTLTGADPEHTIVAVTPDAICAHALSLAERSADSFVAAEAIRHEVLPS